MNIIGEYSLSYNIYTMFNVYEIKIVNHNLITKNGYDFFLRKWYQNEHYPIVLGYYHENKFYGGKNPNGTYTDDLSDYDNGSYSTSMNYIDKETYNQYKYDGENFVDFYEKLNKICIGSCNYIDDVQSKPSENDNELYDSSSQEYEVSDFQLNPTELILKYEIEDTKLNGTTEIGVKTNHGRLVSHDIHPPYNLPFGSNLTLQYSFKLK